MIYYYTGLVFSAIAVISACVMFAKTKRGKAEIETLIEKELAVLEKLEAVKQLINASYFNYWGTGGSSADVVPNYLDYNIPLTFRYRVKDATMEKESFAMNCSVELKYLQDVGSEQIAEQQYRHFFNCDEKYHRILHYYHDDIIKKLSSAIDNYRDAQKKLDVTE
jgi:hypothetical protein